MLVTIEILIFIAQSKKSKLVLCIDEFQNIAFFDDPLAFQKKLRSHWQTHQSVSYCLYGSTFWIPFIVERFRSTGKEISELQAEKIAVMAEGHPYYVQQLAQKSLIEKEIIDEQAGGVIILDPVYSNWLRNYYFV